MITDWRFPQATSSTPGFHIIMALQLVVRVLQG